MAARKAIKPVRVIVLTILIPHAKSLFHNLIQVKCQTSSGTCALMQGAYGENPQASRTPLETVFRLHGVKNNTATIKFS
jgi:hypothetical protein